MFTVPNKANSIELCRWGFELSCFLIFSLKCTKSVTPISVHACHRQTVNMESRKGVFLLHPQIELFLG